MGVLKIILVLATGLALVDAASAEDDFAASFRLRGGYDSNPQFSAGRGIGGSAFIGSDTALAAGTKQDGYSAGIAAEAGAVHYANALATPALNGRVILRGSIGDDAAKLSSTTTIADTSSYNLRSSDVIESLKGEVKFGAVKLFATAEGGRSSLNQTNALFQNFLPRPQQFWRATLIPGASIAFDKMEAGVSVNLSARRYTEAFDDFGYHRDNERIQPYLFAKYDDTELSATAAVSQLYGTWHDPDFSNVRRVLFDANVTWRPKPFTIEVSAVRRVGETTFPISPITIDTIYAVKGSWQVDPKLKLAASAGYADTAYLDSPFTSKVKTFGLGAQRDLGHDLTWGVDLTYASGTLISGDRANAMIFASSITKRFVPEAKAASAPKT